MCGELFWIPNSLIIGKQIKIEFLNKELKNKFNGKTQTLARCNKQLPWYKNNSSYFFPNLFRYIA